MAIADASYDIVLLGISQIRPTEQSDPGQVAALLTEDAVMAGVAGVPFRVARAVPLAASPSISLIEAAS